MSQPIVFLRRSSNIGKKSALEQNKKMVQQETSSTILLSAAHGLQTEQLNNSLHYKLILSKAADTLTASLPASLSAAALVKVQMQPLQDQTTSNNTLVNKNSNEALITLAYEAAQEANSVILSIPQQETKRLQANTEYEVSFTFNDNSTVSCPYVLIIKAKSETSLKRKLSSEQQEDEQTSVVVNDERLNNKTAVQTFMSSISDYAARIKATTVEVKFWREYRGAKFANEVIIKKFRPLLRFYHPLIEFDLSTIVPNPNKELFPMVTEVARRVARLHINPSMDKPSIQVCSGFYLTKDLFVFPKSAYEKYKLDKKEVWQYCAVNYSYDGNMPFGQETKFRSGHVPRVLNTYLLCCEVEQVPIAFKEDFKMQFCDYDKHDFQPISPPPVKTSNIEKMVFTMGYDDPSDYEMFPELSKLYKTYYTHVLQMKCISPGFVVLQENQPAKKCHSAYDWFETDCLLLNAGSLILNHVSNYV